MRCENQKRERREKEGKGVRSRGKGVIEERGSIERERGSGLESWKGSQVYHRSMSGAAYSLPAFLCFMIFLPPRTITPHGREVNRKILGELPLAVTPRDD